jgi:hypothetical protein
MASNNQLLGSGKPVQQEVVKEEVNTFAPILLHSTTETRVVKTKKEFDELVAAGWKDHPGKVRLLPAFKHLYEGEPVTESNIDHSELNEKSKSLFEEE